MSAKNNDAKGRWRNVTVAFRVSPEENEEITIGKIKFKVEEVEKNRIKKVRIYT